MERVHSSVDEAFRPSKMAVLPLLNSSAFRLLIFFRLMRPRTAGRTFWCANGPTSDADIRAARPNVNTPPMPPPSVSCNNRQGGWKFLRVTKSTLGSQYPFRHSPGVVTRRRLTTSEFSITNGAAGPSFLHQRRAGPQLFVFSDERRKGFLWQSTATCPPNSKTLTGRPNQKSQSVTVSIACANKPVTIERKAAKTTHQKSGAAAFRAIYLPSLRPAELVLGRRVRSQ